MTTDLSEAYVSSYFASQDPQERELGTIRVVVALIDLHRFAAVLKNKTAMYEAVFHQPLSSIKVSIGLDVPPLKAKTIVAHERSAAALAKSVYAQADSRRLWIESEPEVSMLPSRPALGVRGCQVLTSVFAPLPVEANHRRRVEALRRALRDIENGKLCQIDYLVREMCTQRYLPQLPIPFGTDLVHYVISVPNGVVDAHGNIIVQNPMRILYEAQHHSAMHEMTEPAPHTRVPHYKMVANLVLGRWASHWAHCLLYVIPNMIKLLPYLLQHPQVPILMVNPDSSTIDEIFGFLGISQGRIVDMGADGAPSGLSYVSADEVLVAGAAPGTWHLPPPGDMQRLRAAVLLKSQIDFKEQSPIPGVVLIRRGWREIANIGTIAMLLFEVADIYRYNASILDVMTKPTLTSQIRLAHNAILFVGSGGSALFPCMWGPKGSHVLELMYPQTVKNPYSDVWNVMAAVGIQHWFTACFETNFTCSELDFVASVTTILGPLPLSPNESSGNGPETFPSATETQALASNGTASEAVEGNHTLLVSKRLSAAFGEGFALSLHQLSSVGWNATNIAWCSQHEDQIVIAATQSLYYAYSGSIRVPFSIHFSCVMPTSPSFQSARVCLVQCISGNVRPDAKCVTDWTNAMPHLAGQMGTNVIQLYALNAGRVELALKLQYKLSNGTSASRKQTRHAPCFLGSFRTSEFIASPLGPDDAIYTSPEVEVGIEFNSQSDFMQPEALVQLVLTLSNEAGTIRFPNARASTR
jgi:hypothetical protein